MCIRDRVKAAGYKKGGRVSPTLSIMTAMKAVCVALYGSLECRVLIVAVWSCYTIAVDFYCICTLPLRMLYFSEIEITFTS